MAAFRIQKALDKAVTHNSHSHGIETTERRSRETLCPESARGVFVYMYMHMCMCMCM